MSKQYMTRRSFLAAAALAGVAVVFPGCTSAKGGDDDKADAGRTVEGEGEGDSKGASQDEAPDPDATDPEKREPGTPKAGALKIAVVAFSCTGNTWGVAKKLAKGMDAELMRLEPAKPYTKDDLTYEKDCRANAEQSDADARPEIANVPDLSSYDVVFLGHPIWWATEPRIIDTLIDSGALDGKLVAQFCTSGSSGIEDASRSVEALSPRITWVGARRFEVDASQEELIEWGKSVL